MNIKSKKLKRGDKYEFLWLDTYNFIGWHFEDDIDGRTIDREFQSTIGFFIKRVKDWYVVAMMRNPNYELGFPQWGNICYIPCSAIKNITNL